MTGTAKAGGAVTDVIEIILSSVSAFDCAKAMGLNPDRTGRCACPIHNGKDRNCVVYHGRRGYYCHVCHSGGDVIDMVKVVNQCSFKSALEWLNSAFHLGLDLSHKPDKNALKGIKTASMMRSLKEANARDMDMLQFDLLVTAQRLLCLTEQDMERFAPVHPYRPWPKQYEEAARLIPELEDFVERMQS